MKKEAISHGVLEDLANRNDNWDKLDGVPEKVDLLTESKADKVEVDASLELKADITYVDTKLSEKANKQQEAWITPTLLNGWYAIRPSEPPQYMKDDLGFVHFRGAISKGANATSNVAFQLPVGYRPDVQTSFSISEVAVSGRTLAISIFTLGTVDFAGAQLNSWYAISLITFKVV